MSGIKLRLNCHGCMSTKLVPGTGLEGRALISRFGNVEFPANIDGWTLHSTDGLTLCPACKATLGAPSIPGETGRRLAGGENQ